MRRIVLEFPDDIDLSRFSIPVVYEWGEEEAWTDGNAVLEHLQRLSQLLREARLYHVYQHMRHDYDVFCGHPRLKWRFTHEGAQYEAWVQLTKHGYHCVRMANGLVTPGDAHDSAILDGNLIWQWLCSMEGKRGVDWGSVSGGEQWQQ